MAKVTVKLTKGQREAFKPLFSEVDKAARANNRGCIMAQIFEERDGEIVGYFLTREQYDIVAPAIRSALALKAAQPQPVVLKRRHGNG